MKNGKNKTKNVLLRLPEDVWRRVFERSKKNNRSINGQIVQELQEN